VSSYYGSLFAKLSPEERAAAIAALPNDTAQTILYDWDGWARDEQKPPSGDWFVWLLRSGRGFGKTRTGSETVRHYVGQGYRRIALVGQTKADVRDTMVEVGESALLNVCPPTDRPEYQPSKRRVVWPNGAMAILYSGDEPDQLRGPQHDLAWVDELAKFKYPQETWDNLMLGLRVGPDPRVVVTTTPRPIPLLKHLIEQPSTVDVQRPTYDNVANLHPRYVQQVIEPMRGTRLGRQEIEGEILTDTPGALWTYERIDKGRVHDLAENALVRVVVAIDPAMTATDGSDETGIMMAGLGRDGDYYVLRDASLKASPHGWASMAVGLYHQHKADRIIGETNNGGDMVGSTIRAVDASVSYKGVHASRGKYTRAEPVAALYEQGRVHHVGAFAELEDQMCTYVPGDSNSPDRMDALVWALTDLALGERSGWSIQEY
jgi:predicted phage terminase large subunit-like protein